MVRGACLPVTLLSGGCRVWCDPEGAAAFVAVAFALADGAVFYFRFFCKCLELCLHRGTGLWRGRWWACLSDAVVVDDVGASVCSVFLQWWSM